MRFRSKPILTIFFSVLLSIAASAFMSSDELYIMMPALVCVTIMCWFWMILWERDGAIPFFDVGIFCGFATLAYTVYPLINYWVDDFRFGVLSDNRLQQYYIPPPHLGFFHLRHVLYLVSFIIFYLIYRGSGSIRIGKISSPSRPTQHAIIIFFLTLTGYFLLLQLVTGVNYNSSYESESRTQYLSAVASLPLVVVQISGKLGGILFIFKLALLFIIFNINTKKQSLTILFIWVAVEIIQAVVLKGSRTGLILFILSAVLFYHRMFKPLSMKFLLGSGTIFFVFFNFLGVYRSHTDLSSFISNLLEAEGSFFSRTNEFQALFATAYEVYHLKEAGIYLPWYLYINDFISILPPQQMLPFPKITAAEWYLRQIGLSGTGQGYMWGVISQAIIGLDWWELPLRGAILGYILAQFHRWYIKHQSGFLETLAYVFLCLKVYYTFRDTTFSLLTNIIWEVIPFYLLLRIGESILSRNISDVRLRNRNRVVAHSLSVK